MKNIIVPVDFSAESLNGLKMALLFAGTMKVNIHLVHVLQKVAEADKATVEAETLRAESEFQKIISVHKAKITNDSEINCIVSKGRIYQEIVTLADKFEDSLITTSTHGASGFQEVFMGSNAFRIISATAKPVITLRKNYCPASIGKIVLPIDLSADSRQKVPFTIELARLFNAEIHVVGVHTSKSKTSVKKIRSYTSQVAGYVEGKVPCESNEVFGDDAPGMIINYANTVKADLISITTEQSGAISLIMGNTAHQILNKADIPVLCLTPKHITKSGSFASMGG